MIMFRHMHVRHIHTPHTHIAHVHAMPRGCAEHAQSPRASDTCDPLALALQLW